MIKFLQSKTNNKKNGSYYGFLKVINEENLPVFDKTQERFINYVSEMLPIVRPYEYLIIQKLIYCAGKETQEKLKEYVQSNTNGFEQDGFNHALHYMLQKDFFSDDSGMIKLNVPLDVELEAYMKDLLEYGLGKYDIDFSGKRADQKFWLWKPYRKEQVQQLLLNNPGDIMKGTKIYDGVVYAYVTIVKSNSTKDDLKYADGYIDKDTFQWETVANVSNKELDELKNSKGIHLFVRKVENEDGITLPFTYIGYGYMEFIEGSKKDN